ncbi:MAG: N-acetylgalactosamine-6-sulfatase [Planctomycetes bacterium]|nr:N-acetylgalactosamine-6-sulfatase [Planctomycetota bacterium]
MRVAMAFFAVLLFAPRAAFDADAAASEAVRPNLLLIVADDLGYGDLGCCGREDVLTPHLDKLAAEGVRATHFYVTWPACTPSRGSILTGRYPQRNGLYEMIRNDLVNYGHRYTEAEYAISPEMTLGLDLRERTIADVLKAAGYACGIVGKWDSGRARRFLPLQRGFDVFYGFANTDIDYWTHERYGIPSMFRGNEPIKEEGYATDLFGREAERFLREHAGRPFFLYVAFNAPHGASNLEKDSLQAPAETLARYAGGESGARATKYLAMITRMDDMIGRLLATLDELRLSERTLVLFTSDNGGAGPARNVPLQGRKATLWEGGVRVPLIARYPGRLPAGRTCDEFLTTLELFPTCAALGGTEVPEQIALDGYDMLPVLAGAGPSPRASMFWEHRGGRAARLGRFKWLDAGKATGLYDVVADPGETRDLSVQHPEQVRELEAAWAAWRREMDAAEPRGPFRDY